MLVTRSFGAYRFPNGPGREPRRLYVVTRDEFGHASEDERRDLIVEP